MERRHETAACKDSRPQALRAAQDSQDEPQDVLGKGCVVRLDLPLPETIRSYSIGLPREVVGRYATFPSNEPPAKLFGPVSKITQYRRAIRARYHAMGLNSAGKPFKRKPNTKGTK